MLTCLSTTDVDLGTAVSRAITPTAAGTYTYTITATNSVGVSTTTTKQVIVEAAPTFTAFTVNGATSIKVAPNATLTYASGGFTTGSSFVARNSANTAAAATPPAKAPTAAGTTTYYGAATKTLNGVSLYSGLKSVSVQVVPNPTISGISGPTNVFANEPLSISWSGTNASSYRIRSNSASSGISTSDVNLGTATSRSIKPTGTGTFTYTVTVVNSVGAVSTSTKTIVVEPDPSFSSVKANGVLLTGTNSITLAPNANLSFVSSGVSSGAGSLLAMNGALWAVSAPVPSTPGVYEYQFTVYKGLNGVNKYGQLRKLNVTVTAPGPVCYPNNASNQWLVVTNNNCISNNSFNVSYSVIINGVKYNNISPRVGGGANENQNLCLSSLSATVNSYNAGKNSLPVGGKIVDLVSGNKVCY